MELFRAIWSYFELFGAIWSYLELFTAIWSYLVLFGAIWTFSSLPPFPTFCTFPTILTFPAISTFPTFPTFSHISTFPTFLVWSAQGISENISHLVVRDIKSPTSFRPPPLPPYWSPLYRSLGGYGDRGYFPRITNMILEFNSLPKIFDSMRIRIVNQSYPQINTLAPHGGPP